MFDDVQTKVVINHEEQYSIWPADRENPLGWRDAGKVGSKDECLAHVEQVWTDMRPLSLRQYMAALPGREAPADSQNRKKAKVANRSRGRSAAKAAPALRSVE